MWRENPGALHTYTFAYSLLAKGARARAKTKSVSIMIHGDAAEIVSFMGTKASSYYYIVVFLTWLPTFS